jgi:hypothetical protein
MAKATATAPNSLIQAVIIKKCDRANHRPDSNKACANGTCQHTCEPAQVEACSHKWTVRYSVNSRQREKSFAAYTDAETFQLNLSADKKAQGALFVDPKAGNRPFLPECIKFIDGLAKAKPASKELYKSNFGVNIQTPLLSV